MTIARSLKAFNFTLKRFSLIPARRNDQLAIEQRYAYASLYLNMLTTVEEKHIYFIDEAGFNISMRVRRGRSLVGTRAVRIVRNIRSRNITLCCAIGKEGILNYETSQGSYNTDKFFEFVRNTIDVIRSKNIQNAILIMDNVPFHKSERIQQLV
jgi:hypothetical protein